MDETGGTLRLRHAVLALAAATLTFLLPTLAAGLDGTTALTGALLAVAVAALFVAARDTAAWRVRRAAGPLVTGRPVPIVLATRATDPTHHPLRPRAPGSD